MQYLSPIATTALVAVAAQLVTLPPWCKWPVTFVAVLFVVAAWWPKPKPAPTAAQVALRQAQAAQARIHRRPCFTPGGRSQARAQVARLQCDIDYWREVVAEEEAANVQG